MYISATKYHQNCLKKFMLVNREMNVTQLEPDQQCTIQGFIWNHKKKSGSTKK